jgi:class 3 adenylate cyclase
LQQQALPGTIELDMSSRTTRPTAQKRPKVAAPLDNASRAVRRLLAAEGDVAVERVTEQIPAIAPQGTGTERPLPEWVELNQSLYRVFAFVDVCGFTKYTDQFGAHAATEMLSRFRSACRDVTARRGARVAKWLGDGVMLVGTEPGPVIATVAELLLRFRDDAFEIHAGIAAGTVLLFEGDDYIGRSVNLAARLCEAAAPGELLAHAVDDAVPDWVNLAGTVTVRAMGIGDVAGVSQLRVDDQAWATMSPVVSHPSLALVSTEFSPLLDERSDDHVD